MSIGWFCSKNGILRGTAFVLNVASRTEFGGFISDLFLVWVGFNHMQANSGHPIKANLVLRQDKPVLFPTYPLNFFAVRFMTGKHTGKCGVEIYRGDIVYNLSATKSRSTHDNQVAWKRSKSHWYSYSGSVAALQLPDWPLHGGAQCAYVGTCVTLLHTAVRYVPGMGHSECMCITRVRDRFVVV